MDWIAIDFLYHQRSAHIFKKHKRDLIAFMKVLNDIDSDYGIQEIDNGIMLFKLGANDKPESQKKLDLIIGQAKMI